eukprot:863591-Amphidinium_carterae.1
MGEDQEANEHKGFVTFPQAGQAGQHVAPLKAYRELLHVNQMAQSQTQRSHVLWECSSPSSFPSREASPTTGDGLHLSDGEMSMKVVRANFTEQNSHKNEIVWVTGCHLAWSPVRDIH